jgi:hypothetical protein
MIARHCRIMAMHGVAQAAEPASPRYRNCMDLEAFQGYLQRLEEPFLPLAQVLAEGGDALTIDDGSAGALEAARIAVTLGHSVTWFVNPGLLEDHLEPPLSILDEMAAMDMRSCAAAIGDLLGERAMDYADLRLRLKLTLRRMPASEAYPRVIDPLASRMGLASPPVPTGPNRLATLGDVLAANDMGIDIQDHGWEHVEPCAYLPEAFARTEAQAEGWFRTRLGRMPDVYASPFGESLPSGRMCRKRPRLLLDGRLRPGWVGEGVFNRIGLKVGKTR